MLSSASALARHDSVDAPGYTRAEQAIHQISEDAFNQEGLAYWRESVGAPTVSQSREPWKEVARVNGPAFAYYYDFICHPARAAYWRNPRTSVTRSNGETRKILKCLEQFKGLQQSQPTEEAKSQLRDDFLGDFVPVEKLLGTREAGLVPSDLLSVEESPLTSLGKPRAHAMAFVHYNALRDLYEDPTQRVFVKNILDQLLRSMERNQLSHYADKIRGTWDDFRSGF